MKQYITPDMEITEFETEDVITTSNGLNNQGTGSGDYQGEAGDFGW